MECLRDDADREVYAGRRLTHTNMNAIIVPLETKITALIRFKKWLVFGPTSELFLC